ncbi:MAG: histone H1 [Aestuariivita sp.]|nr:histone H1 [Aestuariivita sp.]
MTPFRPKDTNKLGKHIVDLATGEAVGTYGKDPDAVERGKKGGAISGRSKSDSMTREERSDHGRAMAEARWS